MAEKTFNARLKLKYDSHENWISNDPVLLQGEVALSVVNVKQEGTVNEVPSVLIKVGDGTHKYSELGFTYAKAADVLPEAKSTESLTTFINNVIANAGIATNDALTALSGRVTTAEGNITSLQGLVGDTAVATQITNAIAALKLDETYDTKGAAAAVETKLNAYKTTNDAAVKANKDSIDAIKDGTTIDSFADVETALAGKQAVGDYATKAEAQGYADAKDDAIAAAKKAGDDAQADVDALEAKVGNVPADKTVVQMISDAQTAATYDDTALKGRVSAVEGLVGDTAVATQISTAVSAEKTRAEGVESGLNSRLAAVEADYLKAADKTELTSAIATAKTEAIETVLGEAVPEQFDTLKEVAEWIQSDTTASAQLITRVTNIENDYLKAADKTELQGAIDDLEAYVGTIPEGATSANVVAYIQEVVDGLKIGDYAKAADLTALATRVTTAEGKITALETKVGDATVASQITSAINELKNGQLTTMQGEIDAVEDRATALEAAKHTHDNKTVLDGITSEKVTAWDKVSEKANDADLAAIAKSGNVNDLVQTEGDVIVFNCGTASTVI